MNIRRNHISLSNTELLIGAAVFLIVVAVVGGSRILRISDSKAISPVSDKPIDIFLTKKTDLPSLGKMLADSGVVSNKSDLLWAGNLLGWRTFQQGHYRVETGYSYDAFLSKLARGIQDPIRLTLLPGITRNRLIKSMAKHMEFDSVAFKRVINDSTFLANQGLTRKNFMGHMLPSTYSIYWTSSPKSVIKRVLSEFDKKIYQPNENRFSKLDRSVDEILTLASIIEWEAKNKNEKKRISGLYWNRLRKGMLLQADPTINFVLKKRRRLLYKDYQIDDPYNTYIHPGLPPGPITNPSESSIEAALYPEDNNYLYMVASPDGTHAFSETFKEHKEKSEKWRKWLQKQYRIKREREQATNSK